MNIRMQRATRAERPAPLDAKAEAEGAVLARKCARWAADNAEQLAADPAMPANLFNRSADNWRALFAIATAAGGDWVERLTKASSALAPADDDDGRGIRLLADIRTIFDGEERIERIASAALCEALVAIDTSPWAEINHGRPITPVQLARLLKPFGVRPGTQRDGEETFKGYERPDFAEAWRRYLDDMQPEGNFDPSHRHNPQKTSVSAEFDPSHPMVCVTGQKSENPRDSAGCDGVTDQIGEIR